MNQRDESNSPRWLENVIIVLFCIAVAVLTFHLLTESPAHIFNPHIFNQINNNF